MKTWKLISGILSIVLSAVVIFQSGMAGLANTLEENGQSGGSAGFLVAILMLAGGIISIVVRKNTGKGGNIALIVMFTLAALMGFSMAGDYTDLKIWSFWCLVCAVLALISILIEKKANKKATEHLES